MTDISGQIKEGDLSEFRPQSINANLHTQRGEGMLETSMHDVGFVAPITVAADGEAFDGSSRLEKAAIVFGDVAPLVIEHDGTRPVIIKRTDIPTASHPKAVKASVYANRVAEVSLDWDTEILEEWNDEGILSVDEMWFPEEMEGWGDESKWNKYENTNELDIKSAEDKLNEQFNKPGKEKESVICPHCGGEFLHG